MKILFSFVLFAITMQVCSQDLSVRSFNVDLSDQTANVKERLDLNKQPCGLIKVSLPLKDVVFEGDIIGNVAYSAGEYWVYVIDGTEMLTIKHSEFHALNLTLSEKVKSKRTYRLVINVPTYHNFNKGTSIGVSLKENEKLDKESVDALKFYKHLADVERLFAKANNKHNSKEYFEAIKHYFKLAEQGDADAQYQLGWFYCMGYGVSQDYVEAVKWYRKSAEQGNAEAQYYLGYMYYVGYGILKDNTEAIKWYRKSVNQTNIQK